MRGLLLLLVLAAVCFCNRNAHAFGLLPTISLKSVVSRCATIGHHHADYTDSTESPDPVASIEILDALVPRAKITALSKSKSNLQGVSQTLWHMGLFGLASALPPFFSLLGMSFVSAFFFCGLHETVHRTAFRSKAVNDAVAHVFGFLCLRPARHYFHYHWQHHKYTGNKELDSELQSGSFLDLPVETPLGYLAYISGIPFWIDAICTTIQHACGNCPESYLASSSKAHQEVTREARIYLLLYLITFVSATVSSVTATALMRLWVLPALWGQPFLRFYLMAEHRGKLMSSNVIYENTRTMHTNWWYRKLAWSMPFHMEHHAWPSVPFHKLQDAHALLLLLVSDDETAPGRKQDLFRENDADLLGAERKGYISFNWTIVKRLFASNKGGEGLKQKMGELT